MANRSARSWKLERAHVHRGERSNKYSGGDERRTPRSGRSRAWVGGYTRADGTKVRGHYRAMRSS
jgi:hypothetical protein